MLIAVDADQFRQRDARAATNTHRLERAILHEPINRAFMHLEILGCFLNAEEERTGRDESLQSTHVLRVESPRVKIIRVGTKTETNHSLSQLLAETNLNLSQLLARLGSANDSGFLKLGA